MSKKLSEVDIFYINHHKDTLSVEAIAKRIGCTARTIYNHINRLKGDMRTQQGREQAKGEEVRPAVSPYVAEIKSENPLPQSSTLPAPGEATRQLVGSHKHGSSGAVVMTKELSEVGDEINKSGRNFNPEYMRKIRPDE